MHERTRHLLRTWGPGLAVAVGLTVVQLAWVAHDTSGMLNDDRSLFRAAACLEASWGTAHAGAECLGQTPYPPLIPAWTAAHFALFGASVQGAVASLWPFWLLLGLAAYGAVQRHAGALAGVAAAVLATLLAVHTHLRAFYFSEIPLAAAALGALACWDASDGLRRRLPTVGLGACLGLGLMCKWSFGFFLGPPMALALVLVLLRVPLRWGATVGPALLILAAAAMVAAGLGGGIGAGVPLGLGLLGLAVAWLACLAWRRPERLAEDGRQRLLGAGLLVLVVGLLAGPWYLGHAESMQAFLRSNLELQYEGEPLTLAQSWVYYPIVAWFRVPTPVVPLLLLALVRSLWPGGGRHGGWAWWVLLSGMVVLAVLPYRADRYLVPGLPILAVPALLALRGWARPLRWLGVTLLAWGLVFHLGWLPALRGRDLRASLPRVLDDVAPFGFPGNEWGGIQLAMDLMGDSPWTFQLIAHAPKPYGEPWGAVLERLGQARAPDCPSLVLLHCDGPCDWNLLDDLLYASAPFAGSRLAMLEGPADAPQLMDRARGLAPFEPSRDGWPVNLCLVSLAPPERAGELAAIYGGVGLVPVDLGVEDPAGVGMWLASEPGLAVGCGQPGGPPLAPQPDRGGSP
jgi:hypothetical protein